MHFNRNFKIFFCLATLSPIFAIPTTTGSALITNVSQISESQISDQNTTNGTTLRNSENSPETQESQRISENKFNKSVVERTTSLPSNESDFNNKIKDKSSVDQLSDLSSDKINTSSVESKFENNDISTDLSQSTATPVINRADVNTNHQNAINDSNIKEKIEVQNQNSITSNESLISNPVIKNQQILEVEGDLQTLNAEEKIVTTHESHRNKRSFFRNTLHSNLDELLNMKRQRRASMRSKRNTDYEDLLSSLLAAEEAKNIENYGSYFDKNDLNALAMNYILNNINSDDSDNKYPDLDELRKYYYENLLPLIDSIDTESDSTPEEESLTQDLPIIVEPYSRSVIPVVTNRYQRIRRSFYDRYRNPISVYTGLKRKRSRNPGEWGRIVGAKSDRSANDDEEQEANKIYSLATLLATGNTPEEHRLRYKRAVKRSVKPVIAMTLKNM